MCWTKNTKQKLLSVNTKHKVKYTGIYIVEWISLCTFMLLFLSMFDFDSRIFWIFVHVVVLFLYFHPCQNRNNALILFIVDNPCSPGNYIELDHWQRSTGNSYYGQNTMLCDNFLPPGWYRPTSPVGNRMPTECVRGGFRCGTTGSIWLNGQN